jgi:murein L,D-transpeptidase YafK
MKDYIPELSEIRMVQRAPDGPLPFSQSDLAYIADILADMQNSFGFKTFSNVAPQDLSARALIGQLIEWWRALDPTTETQRDAYNRLPGAIRLIDTVSTWVEEQAARRRSQAE